jgi:hypothetical protein
MRMSRKRVTWLLNNGLQVSSISFVIIVLGYPFESCAPLQPKTEAAAVHRDQVAAREQVDRFSILLDTVGHFGDFVRWQCSVDSSGKGILSLYLKRPKYPAKWTPTIIEFEVDKDTLSEIYSELVSNDLLAMAGDHGDPHRDGRQIGSGDDVPQIIQFETRTERCEVEFKAISLLQYYSPEERARFRRFASVWRLVASSMPRGYVDDLVAYDQGLLDKSP